MIGPEIISRILFAVAFIMAFISISTTLYQTFFPEDQSMQKLADRIEFVACKGLRSGIQGCPGSMNAESYYFSEMCGENSRVFVFANNQSKVERTRTTTGTEDGETRTVTSSVTAFSPGPAICCDDRVDRSGEYQFKEHECQEITLPEDTDIELRSPSDPYIGGESALIHIVYNAQEQLTMLAQET